MTPVQDAVARRATSRPSTTSHPSTTSAPIGLDDQGRLHHGGRMVALTTVEHRLAAALIESVGRVVPRRTLLAAGWPDARPTPKALDAQLARLRRHLSEIGLELSNVRRRGYAVRPDTAHTQPTHTPTGPPARSPITLED